MIDLTGRFKRSAVLTALLVSLGACGHIPNVVKVEESTLSAQEDIRLASVYESKGENELALKYYKKAALSDKDNAGLYFSMGNLNFKMKKYKEAEADYLKAIGLKPEAGSFYNNLGWLYMETGNLDKAEEYVREAMQKDPVRMYIYLDTLGVILTKRDYFTEAEDTLNEAEGLVPPEEKDGLKQIYNHLLALYQKAGDKEKAASIEGKIRALDEPAKTEDAAKAPEEE